MLKWVSIGANMLNGGILMKLQSVKKLAAVLLSVSMCLPFTAVSAFALTEIQTVNVTLTSPEVGNNAGSIVATTTTDGVEVGVDMFMRGDEKSMGATEIFRAGIVYGADVRVFAAGIKKGYVLSSSPKLIVNGREVPIRYKDGSRGVVLSMIGEYYFEEGSGAATSKGNYSSGGWHQDGRGWWYQYNNGDYPRNGWTEIASGDGSGKWWYYFGSDGYMREGWLLDPADGNWYYLDPKSGVMQSGWQYIDGKYYYFSEGGSKAVGVMYRNERTPDGYSVDASGACI